VGQQNLKQRHVYVGMIPNSVRNERRPGGWSREEIVGQIYVARGHPAAQGHVHFSARSLMASPDSLVERLQRTVYRVPALVPGASWLKRGPAPAPPRIALAPGGGPGEARLTISPAGNAAPRLWVVRARFGNRWQVELVPGVQREVQLTGTGVLAEVAVSAVDARGSESALARMTPSTAPAVSQEPAPR
jgi:hypothetical protein